MFDRLRKSQFWWPMPRSSMPRLRCSRHGMACLQRSWTTKKKHAWNAFARFDTWSDVRVMLNNGLHKQNIKSLAHHTNQKKETKRANNLYMANEYERNESFRIWLKCSKASSRLCIYCRTNKNVCKQSLHTKGHARCEAFRNVFESTRRMIPYELKRKHDVFVWNE